MICGFAWEPKGTARSRAFPIAAELVRRGHRVTMFLTPYDNPKYSGLTEERHGVRIVNVNVGSAPGFKNVPSIVGKLRAAVRAESPDIVHVFKPKGYAGAACAWLLLTGFRSLVLDCDDWEGWGGWNDVKSYPWAVKEYIDRQEKWLMRRTPVVTVASRELQRRAESLRNSSKSVFYIPNCAGSPGSVAAQREALSSNREAAKMSFGLPDVPVIFFSGHFDVKREIEFFSRTAIFAAKQTGAAIAIVGEGPELTTMKEFFSHHPEVRAQFYPRLPYPRFVELLAATDIAAFPYPDDPIYQAKCSARIVDYMSMGKAIISTSVGQNNDYITNQDNGILTQPGNEEAFIGALVTLIRDPELRARLGRSAQRQLVEKFSWSGQPIETCLEAYEQVSQGHLTRAN